MGETVDETVLDAPPEAVPPDVVPAGPPVLPSARLARLAELAAAAVGPDRVSPVIGPPVLSEQALADVWAAVDASTAANTKRAYASDWARFTT